MPGLYLTLHIILSNWSIFYLCCHLLHFFQSVCDSLELGSPGLNTALQTLTQHCWAEGKDHFHQPAVTSSALCSPGWQWPLGAGGLLFCIKGMLLVHDQQAVVPLYVLGTWNFPMDLRFCLFLQFLRVPLNGHTAILCVIHFHLGLYCLWTCCGCAVIWLLMENSLGPGGPTPMFEGWLVFLIFFSIYCQIADNLIVDNCVDEDCLEVFPQQWWPEFELFVFWWAKQHFQSLKLYWQQH